ncbi:hypothetical protein DAKH74_012310 [Maudiozyma humilis]|uniref:Nucleoplasmin-like domain-containing protein n=1 Tax=Maudiozyma humilis TaxID=51915 RepID=A0AAV5RT53_MAUHU|nr:hypothetical protein DAKH74_012310 [Kazachstania humilis]
MQIDQELPVVNGYIIKNIVCKTASFKVCDAVDSKGNSVVLKVVPSDVKIDLVKEQHVVESFVHNGKMFIVYAENNFASEGPDYFSYYMDVPLPQEDETTTDNIPSIMKHNSDINNAEPPAAAGQHLKFGNMAKATHARNNNSSIGWGSCSKRMRTPIPKGCNGHMLPRTPDSYTSSNLDDSEEDDDDDDDDSEEVGTEFDSDSNSDSNSDSEDEDEEIVTPINRSEDASQVTTTADGIIPILKQHESGVVEANNYTSQAPHIHIQCPVTRILHNRHTAIRKTPVPREMLMNHNHTEPEEPKRQRHMLGVEVTPDLTTVNNSLTATPTNHSCPEGTFKLEMVKSSMLRRRSSSKCQST